MSLLVVNLLFYLFIIAMIPISRLCSDHTQMYKSKNVNSAFTMCWILREFRYDAVQPGVPGFVGDHSSGKNFDFTR